VRPRSAGRRRSQARIAYAAATKSATCSQMRFGNQVLDVFLPI